MKRRFWAILYVTVPLLLLAAEEAPPAEVLENLEFFQNYELIKDSEFLTQATSGDPYVVSSSAPVRPRGDDHANP